MLDQDRAAIGKLADVPIRMLNVAIVSVEQPIEHAALFPQIQKIRPRHSGEKVEAVQPIDFQITVVAEHDALVRIEHHYAGGQVVKGAGDKSRTPDIGVTRAPQRGRDPENDRGKKRGDHEAAHCHLPHERGVRDLQRRCGERAIGIGDDLRGSAARRQNIGAETRGGPHRARCGRSCLLLPAGHYHSAEFFIPQCLAVPLWIG